MGISAAEATRIHKLAQTAGVTDEQIEDWTAQLGGYRYAITSDMASGLKTAVAYEIEKRIKAHTAQAPATATSVPGEPMATERQVEFIASLLAQRVRSGEGGGLVDVDALLIHRGPLNGPAINLQAIRALTRREASLTITSLKGEY